MTSLWSLCSISLGMREQIRPCVESSLFAVPEKISVCRYHCLCVLSSWHKGYEEGSHEVWKGSRSQDQLGYEQSSVARCLERWHFPAWTLLLEQSTCPHPWSVVQAWPQIRAKLVGTKSQVCSFKSIYSSFKGKGSGLQCVHLSSDPLPIVCTSSAKKTTTSTATIPLEIALERSKADALEAGLLSTS